MSTSEPPPAAQAEPARASSDGAPKMLSVEGVSKIFGGLVAVDAVDFSIKPKSVVSIIGPKGAG